MSSRCLFSLPAAIRMRTKAHGKETEPEVGGKARAENLSHAEIAKIASKGGKARAAKLSAAELSRIAKRAVAARERKRKGGK